MKCMDSIKARHQGLTPEFQGISWMLASCFFFALMAVQVRYLSATFNPFPMVFFRNVFALLIITPVLIHAGPSTFYTARLKEHFWRGGFGVVGMLLCMLGFAAIPTTHAVALSFTAPLFTTIAAMVFLKETVGIHRWLALLVGFCGTLIILRPGVGVFDYMSLLMIAATSVWAISGVLVKRLSETEHPRTMVFYLTLLSIPLSFPMLLVHPQLPNWHEVMQFIALGAVSNLGQYCMFHAYGRTDVTIVLPFDFSRLIFVTILSYFMFGEILDVWTAVGSIIIVFSSVYISRREAWRRRKQPVLMGVLHEEIL